jgi:hypothetical protein
MKKPLLTIAAISALSFPAGAVDLLSLGSSGFTVGGATTANYTQTSSALTWTGAQGTGEMVFGGTASSLDWSAVPQFGVRVSLTGTNPDLSFSLQLYDVNFNLGLYEGSTSGLLIGTPTVVPLTLSTSDPGFSLATISGVGIQWNDGGSVTGSMTEIVAVPEPSTFALFALAGLALGAYRFRRCA